MGVRLRRTVGCVVGLLAIIAGSGGPAAGKSPTPSIGSLKQQRQTALQKRRQVEKKLRQVKSQQHQAAVALYQSEQTLASVQNDLRTTRVRLQATEGRLKETKDRLGQVNAELDAHTDALWERLEVFYKQGEVGYIEVLLGATDFEQFVDRATFLRSIAEEDIRLKQQIEEKRAQQEALKGDLERTWREVGSLRDQYTRRAQRVRVETSRKGNLLASVKHDRRAWEAAYEEILDTQRDIERVLYRLQNPPGSAGGSGQVLRGGFIMPCNGRFSSSFGWRIHPILGTRRFHDGQDIAAPHGTTIRAAAAGTVVQSGWMKAYGNAVMISHGSGYTTLYGHCSSLLVREGQSVSQGQPIARVGSTGWSTGPHLHFSVYRNGTAINPRGAR